LHRQSRLGLSPWKHWSRFEQKVRKQETEVLPYLQSIGERSFDIIISAELTTKEGVSTRICTTNYKYLYWNPSQQLAHHTVNGCNVNIGDLMASGTISGKERTSFGSMLEISWKGTQPILLHDGTTRTFLLDGDSITLTAYSERG
jgi:fumarylacetoacetase